MTRALFINSGILGQQTFAHFVRTAFAQERDGVRVTQAVVTEDLTPAEHVMRRLLCLRLWPPGAAGMKNLDFHRFRAEWNAGLLARNRIRRLERQGERFDVLHFHRQATAYASLDRIRTTPSIISCDTTQRCVLQTAHTRLEARSYGPNVRRDGEIFRAARLIVSTSRWAAQSFREDYPECTTEVTVMPNPVEVFPRSSAWAEERYRRAVGTPGYRPRVLFVGGEFPRKGGYDLLCAWREGGLSQRADLDLMTSWPLEPDVVPAGVRQHPNVVAHTEAWYALWHAADIFVLPTLDDAFGLAFQEAAASAVPAIGTRLNAVPEIIQEGSTGLLIAPGDRGALVRALDELIASPERRRDMGTGARAFITVSADPDAYRMKLAAAIRHVAGR